MHVGDPESLDKAAIEDNEATTDALPMTFVDYAELVWKRSGDGQTQQQIADALKWSRSAVADYCSLSKIDKDAWALVAMATNNVATEDNGDNEEIQKVATFSERLLRNILDLDPAQQSGLCKRLSRGKDKKGRPYGKAVMAFGLSSHGGRCAGEWRYYLGSPWRSCNCR